jgi:hypothetical protein
MAMNARLLRPLASGFNPKSISGLELWLDATVSSSLTVPDGVSKWADLSGKGRDALEGTVSNRPTLVTNGMNGKPAVNFLGSGSQTMHGPISMTVTQLSAFVVFQYANLANAGNNRVFSMIVSGALLDFTGTNHLSPLLRHGGGGAANVGPFGGTNIATVATPAYDTPLIYSLVHDGSNVSTRINNGSASTAARTLNTVYTNYGLGSFRSSWNASDAFLTGRIGEVIVYSKAVSDSERSRVMQSLSAKWGITIL